MTEPFNHTPLGSPWQSRINLLHSINVLVLIFWRLLIASSDHLGDDHYLWHVFLILGYLLLAIEWLAGWRQQIKWGIAGLLATLLWVLMLPSWWNAADPAAGIGRALGTGSMLLLAGYLVQVAPTRKRLIVASLIAGLSVQAILALVQYTHVLPSMAEQQSNGTIGQQLSSAMRQDLAERIRNGGSYGTFSIANSLGIMLVLHILLTSGLALNQLRRKRMSPFMVSALLCALSSLALFTTGSKGAFLGLALAGFGAMCWICAPRVRYAFIGLAGGAACALIMLGPVAEIPSVNVRLGYWHSAITLWLQSPWQGIGWGHFAIQNAAVMPLSGEWTARVHNELLEVLTAGGIWAAFGMTALLGHFIWPPQKQQVFSKETSPLACHSPPWLALVFPLIAMYAVLLGTLVSDNLSFWPGASGLGGQVFYAALLGLVGSAVLAVVQIWDADDLTSTEPWRWLGLLVLAATSLIDFHFHEYGILTAIICLCCLSTARSIDLPAKNQNNKSPRSSVFITVLSFAVVLTLVAIMKVAGDRRDDLREAQAVSQLLDQRSITQEQLTALNRRFPLAMNPTEVREQANNWLLATTRKWPASEPLLYKARARIAHPQHRINELTTHADDFHRSKALLSDLAISYAQLRDWSSSLRYAQQAIDHAPWDLRNRLQLVQFYEEVLVHSGLKRKALENFIAQQHKIIQDFNPQVHGRNRVQLN